VKVSPELTEASSDKKPEQTKTLLANLINLNKPLVICTHRPVLPNLISVLETRSNKKHHTKLAQILALKPGSFAVVHLSVNSDPILREVVDVEIHSPVIGKK
jgi:8-oxo-dGTP diphosphatase